jgi:putative DNA primase/helicase
MRRRKLHRVSSHPERKNMSSNAIIETPSSGAPPTEREEREDTFPYVFTLLRAAGRANPPAVDEAIRAAVARLVPAPAGWKNIPQSPLSREIVGCLFRQEHPEYKSLWELVRQAAKDLIASEGNAALPTPGPVPVPAPQSSHPPAPPIRVRYRGAAPDGRLATHELAEIISRDAHFAVDQGRRLYVYENGVYKPSGEGFIKRRVKSIVENSTKPEQWGKKKVEEVVEFVTVDAHLLSDRPPLDVVNVVNGLVNMNARTLLPHSPDHLSSIQLPVIFDPAARCPAWDKFIGEVFPGDTEAIAWEIPAWLMTPDTSIQKAVLLLGDGANGKSTYLSAVLAFLGRRNASAVSLHRLEQDKFAVARLVGRLANICPDLPSNDLASTSVFKAITGGDFLVAERKFHDSFEFLPYARLVFSANHPPKSQDASAAFFRRWVVVPFERVFPENASGTLPRGQLDAMLSDPGELSGVLNKALDALASIREHGLSESESTRRAASDFRQTTDPLAVWLDRHTLLHPQGMIVADALWSKYNEDCVARGRPTLSKQALGRAMAQLRPGVEKRQRTVNGTLAWCYAGIGLLTDEGD